jgi:hypothetical protein
MGLIQNSVQTFLIHLTANHRHKISRVMMSTLIDNSVHYYLVLGTRLFFLLNRWVVNAVKVCS